MGRLRTEGHVVAVERAAQDELGERVLCGRARLLAARQQMQNLLGDPRKVVDGVDVVVFTVVVCLSVDEYSTVVH